MNILQNNSYDSKKELLEKHRDLNNKLVYLVRMSNLMTIEEISNFCKIAKSTTKDWVNRGEMLCKLDKNDLKV